MQLHLPYLLFFTFNTDCSISIQNHVYFLKEQMCHQLENIQVAQYYTDDEYDPMAPHDLKAALGVTDIDTYQRMCWSTITFHLHRLIDAYNCGVP